MSYTQRTGRTGGASIKHEDYEPILTSEVRLNKPQGVTRLLQKVANALIQGTIEQDRAKSITYVCNTLLQSQKLGDLEARLEDIEASIKGE